MVLGFRGEPTDAGEKVALDQEVRSVGKRCWVTGWSLIISGRVAWARVSDETPNDASKSYLFVDGWMDR